MGQRMKIGYCNWCAHNTEHGYYASSALAGVAHALTRIFAGSSGYGPWYCSECRRVVTTIEPPMEDRFSIPLSPTFDSQAAEARSSVRPMVDVEGKAKQSTSRYSQKYRLGIAKRIIEGAATFKQAEQELSVSKKEIWSWLMELHQHDRQQIMQLKKQVRSLEEALGQRVSDAEFGISNSFEQVDVHSWSTVVVDAQLEDLNGLPGKHNY